MSKKKKVKSMKVKYDTWLTLMTIKNHTDEKSIDQVINKLLQDSEKLKAIEEARTG